MDIRRFLSLSQIIPLAGIFILPPMIALILFTSSPFDNAFFAILPREKMATWMTELGWVAPSRVCAGGNCLALYCDVVINGQCHKRNGDGSYSPTSPIGCGGNCSGGSGRCSSGTCPDGKAYKCCARSGSGGCGPIIRGVRGSDCCGGSSKKTPSPAPTPTPPPCDGERIDVRKPRGSYEQDPPHATVVGQDPTVRGFDLEIDLQGGRAERWTMETKQLCNTGSGTYPDDCTGGPWHWSCVWELQERYNDPIIKVEVAMRLHENTIAWIEGDLAARFPGTKRTEPLPKVFTIWEGRSMSVVEDWNYLPSDPGVHGGRIIVTTAGTPISEPQEVSVPFEVHVHLKDTTLWEFN